MDARYFAYGSNLAPARMRGRIPGAEALGAARLQGYRLVWDKRGADGSGKSNLRPDPEALVWGVVYAFDVGRWSDLDACERGYERLELEVGLQGATLPVQTYLSTLRTTQPPFAWYKRLVVEGARAHGLPDDWVRALESVVSQPDR